MAFAFIKPNTKYNIMGLRYYSYALSIGLLIIGLFTIIFGSGLKMGIDFAGGVIVQVQFENKLDDNALKKSLETPDLPGISTQRFGDSGRDYLLRFSADATSDAAQLRTNVVNALAKAFPDNKASIERLELVGPKVGSDLANKALEALYYAILLIAVYISGRFEQRWMAGAMMAAALWGGMYLLTFTSLSMGWQVCASLCVTLIVCWKMRLNFAFGAIVSLIHDVAITTGLLALMHVDIDLNVVAALLTLVGYSLNDTIIVYDRLRENLHKTPTLPLIDIVNAALNQTLSRTLLTSFTTAFATLALLVLGGGVIHDFALTMMIGVVIGTLSSIYVASAILLALGDTELYVKAQEKEEYEKPGEHGIV